MKKKILVLGLSLALMATTFTGCAKEKAPTENKPQVNETKGESASAYKDGEYTAKADEASHGWLAEVKIKVQDGKIVEVDYVEVAVEDSDGVKIGDIKTKDNYDNPAPFEVVPQVQKLIIDNNGTKDLKLDGITGATNTRDGMIELVNKALESAK